MVTLLLRRLLAIVSILLIAAGAVFGGSVLAETVGLVGG